jgi:signal transduction histidine kinase
MKWLRATLVSAIFVGVTALALVELAAMLLVLAPGFGLGLLFLLPRGIAGLRRWTNTWRRLIGRWAGVEIAVPYRPRPAPPVPEADGLYLYDKVLYRSPRLPAFYRRLGWVLTDRATGRDLLWLLINPLVGGALSLGPFMVIWYGLRGSWWHLLAVPLGLASARPAVWLYGRWSRWLLGPIPPERLRGIQARNAAIQVGLRGVGQCLGLVCLVPVSLALLGLTLFGLLLGYGLGLVFLIPPALGHYRWLPNLRRQIASVPRPYAPPEPPEVRTDGLYRVRRQLYKTEQLARLNARWRWLAHDVATWRDLLWLVVDPLVTLALLALPAAAFVYGLWGLALPSLWAALFGAPHAAWYGAVAGHVWLAAPVGLPLVGFALVAAGPLTRLHSRWTGVLLGPTKAAQLRGRVAQLTRTRTDAIDTQAAEVRRIERDLHDGAQARLVAVGLTLGTIERLLETDPAAARLLLAQARETSAAALAELRDLVRGIHPPVLSERGLGDAVRALALDTALAVDVAIDLPHRLAAPVESAAYFAVSELLANAARHAGAGRVTVDVLWRANVLRITVTDNGVGGADPSRGTGLLGVQRRLATFDGTFTLYSPAGGPTVVTMEVPCASFSPKTSSSSATA